MIHWPHPQTTQLAGWQCMVLQWTTHHVCVAEYAPPHHSMDHPPHRYRIYLLAQRHAPLDTANVTSDLLRFLAANDLCDALVAGYEFRYGPPRPSPSEPQLPRKRRAGIYICTTSYNMANRLINGNILII